MKEQKLYFFELVKNKPGKISKFTDTVFEAKV